LEDGDDEKALAKEQWIKGRREVELQHGAKRRKLGVESVGFAVSVREKPTRGASGSGSGSSVDAVSSLRARVLENTAKQSAALGGARSKPPDRRPVIRR